MSEIMLEIGDLQFLRTLPRLTKRYVHGQTEQQEAAENKRIRRLQGRGLLRCVIDTEESVGHFILAELTLTDAGLAVLAADA
jgi:hypothetical protein